MSAFEKIGQVVRLLWSRVTCFNKIGATEEQILECQNAIREFLSYAVFQKQSYTASSVQGVHIPPLVFRNMEVFPLGNAMKEILHKAAVDDFGDSKRKVRNWESQMLQEVRKLNPDIRSTPYTVFVFQLPQHQEFQKVKVTKKSSVLKVPCNIEGGFFMEIANGINGELQAHYNDGILFVYSVNDKFGLTLITANDLCSGGQASEVTQQGAINDVKKRMKY